MVVRKFRRVIRKAGDANRGGDENFSRDFLIVEEFSAGGIDGSQSHGKRIFVDAELNVSFVESFVDRI